MKVTRTTSGDGANVKCNLSVRIKTWPGRGTLVGVVRGGASVAGGMGKRPVSFAKTDCVEAVVKSLFKTTVPKIIKRHSSSTKGAN